MIKSQSCDPGTWTRQVVTSNEDMLAEAVRDGTLKGLGSGSKCMNHPYSLST